MELNGTCVAIANGVEYTKKTGEKDKKYYFTIEVSNSDYKDKVAFLVFGEEKFNKMGIVVGGTYNVAFNLSSREWQGKWFTDATAFRVARLDNGASVATAQPAAQPAPQPVVEQPQPQQSDMPF